jgi:hypothetical protein
MFLNWSEEQRGKLNLRKEYVLVAKMSTAHILVSVLNPLKRCRVTDEAVEESVIQEELSKLTNKRVYYLTFVSLLL